MARQPISLDEKDFYTLVSWWVILKWHYAITLQDIWYDVMINNIDHAIQNKPPL